MTTFTCKVCGHRTRSLSAMRKHYQKKHSALMKRRIKAGRGKRAGRKRGASRAARASISLSKVRSMIDDAIGDHEAEYH